MAERRGDQKEKPYGVGGHPLSYSDPIKDAKIDALMTSCRAGGAG